MTKEVSRHTIAGTAYTQTYATADTIVAANAVIADVLQLRKVLNAVIDDLQAQGVVD